MIFNLFKKKCQNDQSIVARLTNILNQRPSNLHITVYLKDQVLFQIMPAKNFKHKGLNASNPNDFVSVHCFSKNRVLTFDKLRKFKSSGFAKEYVFYEEPKGNFNYLKIVGRNPISIEKEIYSNLKEVYELDHLNEIVIDYVDY